MKLYASYASIFCLVCISLISISIISLEEKMSLRADAWIVSSAATFDPVTIRNNTTYVLEGDRTSGMIIRNVEHVTIYLTGKWSNTTGTPLQVFDSSHVHIYNYYCQASANHGFVLSNSKYCTLNDFTINDWTNSTVLCFNGSSYNSFNNGSCVSSNANANNGVNHVDCIGCINNNIYIYGVTGKPGYAFQTKNTATAVCYCNCIAENSKALAVVASPDAPGHHNTFNNMVGKDCKTLYIEGNGCSNNVASISGNVLARAAGGSYAVSLIGNNNSDITCNVTMDDETNPIVNMLNSNNNIVKLTSPSANSILKLENANKNVVLYHGPQDEDNIAGTGSDNKILKVVRSSGNFTDTFYGCLAGAAIPDGTNARFVTAYGYKAAYKNNGSSNTAIGAMSFQENNNGNQNVAVGSAALGYGTGGSFNIAIGHRALHNTQGNNNIAIGNVAGSQLNGTENNDIYIGNVGVTGESNAVRIGTKGTQASTYIAGIYGAKTIGAAVPVVIDSQGKLGTMSSSRTYKTNIETLQDDSIKIRELRPVTFKFKDDKTNSKQYGLIAEEVNEVYPELVTYQNDEIYSVNYMALIPILLKRIQEGDKQRELDHLKIELLEKEIIKLKSNTLIY